MTYPLCWSLASPTSCRSTINGLTPSLFWTRPRWFEGWDALSYSTRKCHGTDWLYLVAALTWPYLAQQDPQQGSHSGTGGLPLLQLSHLLSTDYKGIEAWLMIIDPHSGSHLIKLPDKHPQSCGHLSVNVMVQWSLWFWTLGGQGSSSHLIDKHGQAYGHLSVNVTVQWSQWFWTLRGQGQWSSGQISVDCISL